jgi:hypothetical protein
MACTSWRQARRNRNSPSFMVKETVYGTGQTAPTDSTSPALPTPDQPDHDLRLEY